MKLHKGDTVVVTIGKDKGKKGKIERVNVKEQTILVNGINIYKRHVKKRDDKNPGGIIETTFPIGVSKVAIICPSCGKPTRAGILVSGKDKVRICRKCKHKI